MSEDETIILTEEDKQNILSPQDENEINLTEENENNP